MTDSSDLYVVTVPQADARLGRQVVHDPASRGYEHQPRRAAAGPLVPPVQELLGRKWRHRVYGPRPVPAQDVGCCSGVDQAVKCNAAGNRVAGQVLGLDDAKRIYSRATQIDPWPGSWPPDDTGSSGLAACKAAVEAGWISRYEWIFGGAQAVLSALWLKPVGVGTWWYEAMFRPAYDTLMVQVAGAKVGGHQWSLIGWDPLLRAFEGMCWWGPTFGDRGMFRVGFDDLGRLLADDGDAHVTYRVQPATTT